MTFLFFPRPCSPFAEALLHPAHRLRAQTKAEG
jgi:hypothetical protein